MDALMALFLLVKQLKGQKFAQRRFFEGKTRRVHKHSIRRPHRECVAERDDRGGHRPVLPAGDPGDHDHRQRHACFRPQ